jgi:hypothetical protein
MTGTLPAADREILRDLAARQAELARGAVNLERRSAWTKEKDLAPVRPMVLIEVWPIEGFVTADELLCSTEETRAIEHGFRMGLRHHLEMRDDFVLSETYRLDWVVRSDEYGEGLEIHQLSSHEGPSRGFGFDHPIRTVDRIELLRPRTHRIDRLATLQRKERLESIFGDLLPVELSGGLYHIGLTSELFKLIGNENLMYWCYDEPDAIRSILEFLYEDRRSYLATLEREGCLTSNVRNPFVGSGTPGYTTALLDPGRGVPVDFSKVWAWSEAQETEGISPALFAELFLPSMAKLARQAGLVYYGCCERVDDRIDLIRKAIPSIRAVSCSPWTDVDRLAERLGTGAVLSKKPTASYVSGSEERVDAIEEETRRTVAAARRNGTPLEIVFRDLYTVGGDRAKLSRWAERVRSIAER